MVANFSGGFPNLESLVKVAGETLIPQSSGGFWKLSGQGEAAELVNWRHGLRLARLDRIFPMKGDELLLMDFLGRGEGRFLQLVDRAPAKRPSRIETFRLRVPMIQDAAGALWQIPLDAPERLRQHEGTVWRDLPLPKEIAAEQVAQLAFDSFGCVWLLPDDTTQRVALFDPDQARWRIFETLEMAYELHLPQRAEFRLWAAG